MKRVTKKLVLEVLSSFTDWQFSYNFKDDQALALYRCANVERIISKLSDRGVKCTITRPYKSPCAGQLKLEMETI